MRFGWSWNLGLDWACACAGVIWIPPSPPFFFKNYGDGPPFIILRIGFLFLFFPQMLAWVVFVCGWLGTELSPPSLLLAPTYTFFPPFLLPSQLFAIFSFQIPTFANDRNKVEALSSFPTRAPPLRWLIDEDG